MYKELDDNEILYMIREDEDYYEVLLSKYKPLIISICKKYESIGKEFGYELEDLIQVANIGLFDAINSYKENENTLFYTFLTHCIKNKLKNELRDHQTNKKLALNKAISYDEIIPGTDKTLLDMLPDKSSLDPFDYLLIEQYEIDYINFLNSLPFEVALVYELKNTGFTTDEISKFLEIDKKVIYQCLSMARHQLTV